MPRKTRASVGNMCYHVINRGNNRARIFHKDQDYLRFTEMMGEAIERHPMRLLSWCLMPNHFHMVLWPHNDGDLSTWMHWLMTAHVRRYHRHYNSSGHIWQGRYKAFAIQDNHHYLTVLRYVESNAKRAKLVNRAEDWQWSSFYASCRLDLFPFLTSGPLQRPQNWQALLNQEQPEKEIEQIKLSLNRQRPLGDPKWLEKTVQELGLEYTIRPRGRPKKNIQK
ncbi:MAG: transposase [Phycisphaerae bacterium]|nr:transposase [Phycisphaerae bacterium]